MKLLSLAVPVYYEEECIDQFLFETIPVLEKINYDWEIVFVDDGSGDNTVNKIKSAASLEKRIKLVELSYNHGKNYAVTAAIRYCTGDYILYMDPDLQDIPAEIPNFLDLIEKRFDIVYGIRREKIDGPMNKLFSKIFWSVLRRFSGLKIPKGLAVMRCFTREFANRFLAYPEQNRFIEGIFMHIGMKSTELLIDQGERFAGKSKFNFKRRMLLAANAIIDFSDLPLRIAVIAGFFCAVLGVLGFILILVLKLFIEFQSGWPSIISAIVLGFGVQLLFLGIMALYVGKIYKEVKSRPHYSVRELTNIG